MLSQIWTKEETQNKEISVPEVPGTYAQTQSIKRVEPESVTQ